MSALRDRVSAILGELSKSSTTPFELHALTTAHHRVVLLSTPHAVATLTRPLLDHDDDDNDDDANLRVLIQRDFLPLLAVSVSKAPSLATAVPLSGPTSGRVGSSSSSSSLLVGGNVGARDLHPDFSAAVPGALLGGPTGAPAGFDAGGGMLVGPGAFRPPARRLPGGGAIVPGARFDPIGPGSGLRAPRRAPAPGELPPGFEDEHHMGGGGGYDDMFM